jgi:hypothetical protein
VSIANNPPKGYNDTIPLEFNLNSTSVVYVPYAIGMFVTLNTTQITGLAFVSNEPITVHAEIENMPSDWNQSASSISLTFEDAQQVVNGSEQVTLPTSPSVNIVKQPNGTWDGTGTVYFPFQGNFPAYVTVSYLGQPYTLKEVGSVFAIPIQPLSSVGTNLDNETNIILALALYFFGLLESVLALREIYPETNPTGEVNDSSYAECY